MDLQGVIRKFKSHPKYMEYGAGKMAKQWKCSREDIYQARKVVRAMKRGKKLPKILIYDIETSPMISYHFGHWNQNIYLDQVIENPIMLTWSAKWLFDDEIMSDKIKVDEVLERDDCRLVKGLYDLINEADIVVAHYGDKFDIPMMNNRFLLNGFPPHTTINSIDTKKVASKQFRFPSNKLDALAGYFGFGQKIKTDFLLWRGCMEGKADKIEEMRVYNVQDVAVLEEVYLKLRPYIKSHPNVALYSESTEPCCANCGSENLTEINSSYYTPTGKYKISRCECGALNRERTTSLDKNKRKSLLVSVAK